jgi:iron complex transport system substrate-binding protein
MVFPLLLMTACHHPVVQKPDLSLKPAVECRVIQHHFGETCVPLKLRRIVALNPNSNLDPLIALGIKPIGYAAGVEGKEGLSSVSFDDVKGATNVGKADQPSLEKIVMLKPDLILAINRNSYQSLSAIAPTVAPVPSWLNDSTANEAFFKSNLRFVAKVVGEEAKAEEVISQYQKRIEEFRQRLGNQLEQIEVSVIYYTVGLVYTPAAKSGDASADVLIDTGLRYKRPTPGAPFSIETIEAYDTDILFIITFEREPLSFFSQHPLLSRLKAVKNNRVYLVSPKRWDTTGILGANQILDDLEKYLVK